LQGKSANCQSSALHVQIKV